MTRTILLLLLASALLQPALAQRGPEARARVELNAGLVKLGGEVQMDIVVQDATDARVVNVQPIDGIEILGPGTPSQSRFVEIRNGRQIVQSTKRWPVLLRPQKEGTFTIPDVELEIDGQVRRVPVTPGELEVVRDLEGAAVSYIEWVGLPQVVYEGQPLDLDLRFGWDTGLTPTAFDLRIPWWGDLPNTLSVAGAPRDGSATWRTIQVRRGRSLIELRTEVGAAVQRGDRPFTSNRITDRIVATRPGKLVIPQSVFQFRVPSTSRGNRLDRGEVFYALLDPAVIEVRRVPEEGRPYEWTGAVGEFQVTRDVDRRDVDQGGSLQFTVRWTGRGNLEFFDVPDITRMDAFRGFRMLGVQEEVSGTERVAVFDLVPLDPSLTEVPAFELSVFDTSEGAYTTVATEPVPIRVRPVEGVSLEGLDDGSGLEEDILDIDADPVTRGARRGPGGLALSLLLLSPLLWGLARRAVRRHGDPSAPAARRRRRAPRRLRSDLERARTAREQQRALTNFLSARTGEGPGAWEGRDPEQWRAAVDARLSEPAAVQLHQVLERLDAAVYSGGDRPIAAAEIEDAAAQTLKGGL